MAAAGGPPRPWPVFSELAVRPPQAAGPMRPKAITPIIAPRLKVPRSNGMLVRSTKILGRDLHGTARPREDASIASRFGRQTGIALRSRHRARPIVAPGVKVGGCGLTCAVTPP